MEKEEVAWYYYQNALLPTTAPHEPAEITQLKNRTTWKIRNGRCPLFARWTTEFDCGYETEWWYCIKDTIFSVEELKAKRRYEINKGRKNFDVIQIQPEKYSKALYEVTRRAFEAYPSEKRPFIEQKAFLAALPSWNNKRVYGAFEKESGKLCGYAYLSLYLEYAEFSVLKTIPACEKNGINAAIVAKICEDFNKQIGKGYYICDGSRTVIHETAFQDYLEKYFGFRKAYCKLHLEFRPFIKPFIKFLELFWPILSYLPRKGLWEKVAVVMEMQRISKACRVK